MNYQRLLLCVLCAALSSFIGFSGTAFSKVQQYKINLEDIKSESNRFEKYLREKLDPHVMGYSYFLGKDDKILVENSQGLARSFKDGNLPMTPETKLRLGSVTKVLTSIALFKVFEEHPEFNEDTKVIDLIPYRWRDLIEDNPYADLDFRTLMQHRSGFVHSSSLYVHEVLQMAPKEPLNDRHYSNYNMILIGFAMPYILDPEYMDLVEQEAEKLDLNNEEYQDYIAIFARQFYENYLREKVLKPAGLGQVTCQFNYMNSEPAYFYTNAHDYYTGYQVGETPYTSICAAGSVSMNIHELAQFMWYYLNTDLIVSEESKAKLNYFKFSSFLGWNAFKKYFYNSETRSYLMHGGLFNYGRTQRNSMMGAQDKTAFPRIKNTYAKAGLAISNHGYYAGVMTNSGGNAKGLKNILVDAIEYAIVSDYCTVKKQFPETEASLAHDSYIKHFQLGPLFELSSGQDAQHYQDFTLNEMTLKRDNNYELSINIGLGEKVSDPHHAVIAWIDFDQDLVFEEEEKVLTEESYNVEDKSFETTIYIPEATDLGKTRLRIKIDQMDLIKTIKNEEFQDPCQVTPRGEIEDYSVKFIN